MMRRNLLRIDPITCLIYGAVLFGVIQLCSIKYKLEDISEQLYGIKIRLNRSGKELPNDEEESTDA